MAPCPTSRNETQQVPTLSAYHSNLSGQVRVGEKLPWNLQSIIHMGMDPKQKTQSHTHTNTHTQNKLKVWTSFHPRVCMNGQEACDKHNINKECKWKPWDAVIYSPQWLQLKRLTITTAGEDAGEELSYVVDGMQNIWKTHWQYLTKINSHLSYHPAIPCSSIYRRETKTYFSFCVFTKTHNPWSRGPPRPVALFIKAKN